MFPNFSSEACAVQPIDLIPELRMTAYFLVALGSALGGVLRFWLGELASDKLGAPHHGTLVVNVSGSLIIGAIAAAGPQPFTRQLVIIGLLGGYTTFSSFSLQTLELVHAGRWATAGWNVLLSLVLSLAAVWLGHLCGAAWRR
ncbi:MAG TPA: CrcB family protein [Chthoniobacteraceae bacterium]